MKEKMAKAGYVQGDMSPHAEDYQAPMASFSQKDANMTTEYVERQNRQMNSAAQKVEKHAYKGRYS